MIDISPEPADRIDFAKFVPVLRIVARRELPRWLRVRFDPEDLVQQTCLEAIHDAERFHGDCDAQRAAWLLRILRNNVRNWVRDHGVAQKRSIRREIPFETLGPRTLDFAIRSHSLSPVEAAMIAEWMRIRGP
jgi:DNA-directed RNA polymerase specialized sigma24 family protein